MTPSGDRTEELVDRIIKALLDQMAPDIRKLVVHQWPDTDAWLCLWIAKKFVPKTAEAEIVFVRSGENLPGSDGDPSVLHFDTGGGQYDQHGKDLGRTSSAMLLAQGLGIQGDPGLRALLELSVKVDNVEELSPTEIHYVIEGLPRLLGSKEQDEEGRKRWQPDWSVVQKTVFDMFDIIYGQETGRQESRDMLEEFAGFFTLPNKLRYTELLWHPGLREAAFERGADVILWTQRKKDGFWVGVQVSRRSGALLLDVAANLRKAEAAKRGIALEGDPARVGQEGTNWFLHHSLRFVACGTNTHPVTGDELTKLSWQEISRIVGTTLESVSPELVIANRR